LRAAASTSAFFNARAAPIAALPTMNDTRDEYDPLSLGVSTLSLANTRSRSRPRPSTSATACASSVELP